MNHKQFIYKPGTKTRLKDYDPNFTADFGDEQAAQASMEKDAADIAKYQASGTRYFCFCSTVPNI